MDSNGDDEESAIARLLRLAASPARDPHALAAELARLDTAAGGEGDPGELRAIFRLAQELLIHKEEQVSTLTRELDMLRRSNASSKRRKKLPNEDSPSRSEDGYLDTISRQEEEIGANKEILDQLYADIAELEGRKQELRERDRLQLDVDSNSSREQLSELNAIKQLETQLSAKNRHIRKMLTDIKVLEEENRLLKKKVTVVKEKLSEATHFIETLTEQLLKSKNEFSALTEIIGKSEETKKQLILEIETLKNKLNEKDFNKTEIGEEVQAKLLHWKNNARSRKTENENLLKEISNLKEARDHENNNSYLSNIIQPQEEQIKRLQEKLSEASDEILDSVKIIEYLKNENKKKETSVVENAGALTMDTKSETDDTKSGISLNKMKRKIHNLTTSLKIAEETLALREQELAELSSQLQLLESGEEGVRELLDTLKSKRRQLKLKDVGIKSLVQEINTLSQVVDGLQTENEAMREQLQMGPDETVPTKGVLAKFFKSEKRAEIAEKKLRELENAYVTLELSCRMKEKIVDKLKGCLSESGISEHQIEALICSSDTESEVMPKDGGGESSGVIARRKITHTTEKNFPKISEEMKSLIEENDGLRRGMEEILNFLKDNSTTTSGTLAFQCPSLEKVVQSLDARHAAGWYAPHMAAVMGLQAAIGGRDALLTALHEARKETFDVMQQLSKQSEKSTNLELKLQEIESKYFESPKTNLTADNEVDFKINGVFGTWMSTKDINELNLKDKPKVRDFIENGTRIHETNLREALTYFHKQFSILYEKMTNIAIQTTNDRNKWAIEEEKYKATIANLEAQLDVKNGDDTSENSEGVVLYPNTAVMSRKCTYLEESYRYIRTLNENIKNEFLEVERQKIILIASFESQIQLLMLNIINLTDQLRNSIPIDLFLKQNDILNETNIKYRSILDKNVDSVICVFQKELEKQKKDIIEILANSRIEVNQNGSEQSNFCNSMEHSVVKLQLENVLKKYENILERSKELENVNMALQSSQQQLIDSSLSLDTKQDYEAIKSQVDKLVEENKSLKDQCLHVGNQLEIALLQLQDSQQRHLMNDMEVNMLRHQVLDLQATGDNKAIIARLSGEILIAHLQTSDTAKKIDKLTSALAKEKQRRVEAEEMLNSRENIFNVYAARFESKFRYIFEVMQMLRHQYGGTLPIVSVENYLNNMEDLSRKNQAVEEKLSEIEDLQSNLQTKTIIFSEIIENSQMNCPVSDLKCPHDIKLAINQSVHIREIDHYKKKMDVLERSREDVFKRCEFLEKTLVLINQGFDKEPIPNIADRKMTDIDKTAPLEVQDMPSDDEEDNDSQGSLTITLTQPHILKNERFSIGALIKTSTNASDEMSDLPGSPIKLISTNKDTKGTVNAIAQTDLGIIPTKTKMVQTDSDISITNLKNEIFALKAEKDTKDKELSAALSLASKRADEAITFETSKVIMETNLNSLKENIKKKEIIIDTLKKNLDDIQQQLNSLKYEENIEQKRKKESSNEEIKSLLKAVKKLENDKNEVIEEYKELIKNEREEYFSSIKVYQAKIDELQKKLDTNHFNPVMENDDINPVAAKLSEKLATLEDKCFKLQNTLSGCKTDLKSCEKELERWKALASERLTKIEQMTEQFEERHSHELESYRSESQHWLSELAENQKETLDLRSRLAEQRTLFLKQLTEKDAHIEQHKSAAQNLKTQILSMQSMMSASDPSFDLSAIAEVSETSDASPRGSDRLEIRFHSTHDLGDPTDDSKEPSVLSPTWQENLVERLRREKQLVGKQNALLRRQIKALAGRERRSRLEAQNLKTQMYRLTSSGSKLASADTATISLHNKLAALQAQLLSARRDSHAAGVTAWDKWKRSQQMAERWHAKYEEKCEELRKCENALHTARSAVARLEREKRLLLTRLGEFRSEKQARDMEGGGDADESQRAPPPPAHPPPAPAPAHLSAHALMERVEAQQRRIAALELADKGHEPLVTEYEKLMSQNTMLKGQVLKLESQLLESQLVAGTSGLSQDSARHGELEHLRSYCAALKEENVQLTAKVCSLSAADGAHGSHSGAAHRINDLEQTVLTLRGLVSKLQVEQKKTSPQQRGDSLRPGSGRSAPEYERGGGGGGSGGSGGGGGEWWRAEVARLRRGAAEKDGLLQRSRDLLKMAAEREEEMLKEITFLRQRLDGTTNT